MYIHVYMWFYTSYVLFTIPWLLVAMVTMYLLLTSTHTHTYISYHNMVIGCHGDWVLTPHFHALTLCTLSLVTIPWLLVAMVTGYLLLTSMHTHTYIMYIIISYHTMVIGCHGDYILTLHFHTHTHTLVTIT